MDTRYKSLIENAPYNLLDKETQKLIHKSSREFLWTFQEMREIIIICRDLQMWDFPGFKEYYRPFSGNEKRKKNERKEILKELKEDWIRLKNSPVKYTSTANKGSRPDHGTREIEDSRNILGDCPVASEKTRCCNLKTLDAVMGCGYDCSYCSIQSFYTGGDVSFHKNLKEKLSNLDLDPERDYHIGTGQGSDSLMWGNKNGLLQDLFDFAAKHPRVILEMKTKSGNTDFLKELTPPPNVLFTWSLNPDTVIKNEEHLSSTLEQRLTAARKTAEMGHLVGFHFHPMILFENWKEDYGHIFTRVMKEFNPNQVAMISFGTLTFIKPVLKKIRNRPFYSKVLQIPLHEVEGKFSYKYEQKKEMFQYAFESFKPWHNKVFFYLCMEEKPLWKDVFGKEYPSNDEFEKDMILNYTSKIRERTLNEPKNPSSLSDNNN